MIIRIKNACFQYSPSTPQVFRNINLRINPGEITCILGPNGVGKTTFLKCVAGLLELSDGEIECRGENLQKMNRDRVARIIAHVPQVHYPVFAYTVFDLVLMGRTPYLGFFSFPRHRDMEIARNAIKILGISHLADKPYTEISGGERQLAIFARTLAQEPEVIVLDEPTSHLDYGNQVRILSLIRDLAGKGTAVVMTTHNPDHAFMAAHRVGVMYDGRIDRFDIPGRIITEKKLKQIYRVNVRLLPDSRFGKICVPEID